MLCPFNTIHPIEPEVLILGIILQYMVSASLSSYPYRVYRVKANDKDDPEAHIPLL